MEQYRRNSAVDVGPAAAKWLKNSPKQPFFLDVGFFETHREYPEPTAEDDARYTLPPAPIPDTPQTRKDIAAFRASARCPQSLVKAPPRHRRAVFCVSTRRFLS